MRVHIPERDDIDERGFVLCYFGEGVDLKGLIEGDKDELVV